eukprot:11519315-Ditylum_brightwellii.AAC.1
MLRYVLTRNNWDFQQRFEIPKTYGDQEHLVLAFLVLQDPSSKYSKQLFVFPTCPPGCSFPHGGEPEPRIPPAGLCICWGLGVQGQAQIQTWIFIEYAIKDGLQSLKVAGTKASHCQHLSMGHLSARKIQYSILEISKCLD